MKFSYLDYLDILKKEGKDTSDPTYLMQAFHLTRIQALEAIKVWKEGSRENAEGVMDFYKFCAEKEIRGNLREAFYHHLLSKYSELPEDEVTLDSEWLIVLAMALSKT